MQRLRAANDTTTDGVSLLASNVATALSPGLDDEKKSNKRRGEKKSKPNNVKNTNNFFSIDTYILSIESFPGK